MELQDQKSQAAKDDENKNTIPDESRRKVLGKLGSAAVLVPVVTLIADASTNVAAAS